MSLSDPDTIFIDCLCRVSTSVHTVPLDKLDYKEFTLSTTLRKSSPLSGGQSTWDREEEVGEGVHAKYEFITRHLSEDRREA